MAKCDKCGVEFADGTEHTCTPATEEAPAATEEVVATEAPAEEAPAATPEA
ncbi:MAG: hypothetical protein ABII02_04035 [Candidatus Magasanikbacteria bacterium]